MVRGTGMGLFAGLGLSGGDFEELFSPVGGGGGGSSGLLCFLRGCGRGLGLGTGAADLSSGLGLRGWTRLESLILLWSTSPSSSSFNVSMLSGNIDKAARLRTCSMEGFLRFLWDEALALSLSATRFSLLRTVVSGTNMSSSVDRVNRERERVKREV